MAIKHEEPQQSNSTPISQTRRSALKKMLVGTGVAAGTALLPERWAKPIVDKVLVPAHAQTSCNYSCEITGPADLNIPFGESIYPKWTITNTGNCDLTDGVADFDIDDNTDTLIQTDLDPQTPYNLPNPLKPGEVVVFKANDLKAPNCPGDGEKGAFTVKFESNERNCSFEVNWTCEG